jgi:Serine/threonine protein kinase
LGTFGRVVQAIDLHHYPDGNIERLMDRKQKVNIEDTVAIKIVRDVKRYHESAMIEADILKDVNRRGGRGQSLCAVLLNHFDLKGHCCLVFECLGRSLYDFMKTHGFKPFPLYCVRDFARQLLKALEFIHSFGLIHTDLKPENILLKSNKERQYRLPDGSDQQVPASTSIKLIDFGGATYDHEKKSTIINTRQYRSPEVILGLGWSMPSDMWSAGCIVAELYKGDLLFATHDNFEHLALMERIVGRFPFDMVSRSREFRTSAFDSNGWHKLELSPSSKSYVRKTKPLELVVKNDDRDSGLLELLQSLLTIEPCKRSTASEALMNTSLFNARWS